MRSPSLRLVAAGALATAACGDAVLVVVDGDRAVPDELDAICLAVADRDPAGGHFGRGYRLEGDLAGLPQSLAVEAGGASRADAWVRGYQGGAEVAGDRAGVDFSGDLTLRLDRCVDAPGGAPAVVGTAGPADAIVLRSVGRGGEHVIAIGGGAAAIVDEAPEAVDIPAAAGALGGVSIDVDGDCDDDLVVWTAAEARLLRRDAEGFTDLGVFAALAVRAAAAADVDRDGLQDLVLGGGGTLRVYRATGNTASPGDAFTEDTTASFGGITDVTALALGDVDGDGNPDLLVGQGDATGAPLRAFAASSDGVFSAAPAILPDVAVRARGLALGDLDGDADLDLAVALAGEPARLYVNREGRLEDQSFVRLPQPAPVASAVAAADWNGDCLPDLALAGAGGSRLLRGDDDGTLDDEAAADAATSAVFADLDDDGDRDLVLGTAGGVTWLRR